MPAANFRKVTEFPSPEAFAAYVQSEGFHIGLASQIPSDGSAALAQKCDYAGRTLGNRWAILPMEGWDCQDDGTPSDFTRRRWLRFATSGAKLLFGTEAAAVMESGRSNPQQLMVAPHTKDALASLVKDMRQAHKDKFGTDDDLCIGLQLTHSGRFSHPHEAARLEPVTAYSHPLLDEKFRCKPDNVIRDSEIREVVRHFVQAASIARWAGFDFVDVKHAHGYLGHEFLSAVHRPGPYGGSFENRTRFCREILEGIRENVPDLEIAVRLSIFDMFPFVKGEDGIGHPMPWPAGQPYPYAFGGDGTGLGMDPDLTETVKFVKLLQEYGVKLICASIGSPYYNVHAQRPAYYPVCDGYLPPEPPLYNVGRHLQAVKRLKELCPDVLTVASGLTCLQEYLPNIAEYAIAHGWTDFAGIGRMVLSYPDICADTLEGRPLDRRRICRTFGDCTNAPRHGLISGCYPLDDFYRQRPEALVLKGFKNPKQ